jgi:tRNA threonylcarbamoyladenosine biosynthesis protein TsaB
VSGSAPLAPPRALEGAILAVDASSRPTVALQGPDGEAWGFWEQTPGLRGTASLAVEVARLLDQRQLAVADLAGIAVGIGPGSYTGLRAAIAFARGLCLPSGRALASVCSFEAAARSALRAHPEVSEVVVLLDARRGECYRADYRRAEGGPEPLETGPPRLVPAAESAALDPSPSSHIFVVREPCPEGYDVAALGRRRLLVGGDEPATVLPLYLKRSHAEIALEERARRR